MEETKKPSYEINDINYLCQLERSPYFKIKYYKLKDEHKDKIEIVMPEICRFFGIIITMFADDHNPPHFHVRYGDYEAIVTIDKGVVKGEMPRNALKQVFRWMELNKEELAANWQRLQQGEEPKKIEPLK